MILNRTFPSLFLFSTFLVSTILSSCSNNKPKKPEITETFKTHIDQQDNKDFSFQVTMENEGRDSNSRGARGDGARGQGGGGGRGGEEGRGERGGRDHGGGRGEDNGMRDREEKILQVMNEHLEQLLIDNAYCRGGYELIDQHSRGRSSIIKGRCNELASAADKTHFPNEIIPESIILEEDLGTIN